MKETQRDVQEREEKIKKLAALMGDLITFVEATFLSVETGNAEEEWQRVKLDALSSLSGEKIDNPFSRLSQRLSTRRPNDQAQLKPIEEAYAEEVTAEDIKINRVKDARHQTNEPGRK